jgi:hypothetical protein
MIVSPPEFLPCGKPLVLAHGVTGDKEAEHILHTNILKKAVSIFSKSDV